jgi:hypothetical protein
MSKTKPPLHRSCAPSVSSPPPDQRQSQSPAPAGSRCVPLPYVLAHPLMGVLFQKLGHLRLTACWISCFAPLLSRLCQSVRAKPRNLVRLTLRRYKYPPGTCQGYRPRQNTRYGVSAAQRHLYSRSLWSPFLWTDQPSKYRWRALKNHPRISSCLLDTA